MIFYFKRAHPLGGTGSLDYPPGADLGTDTPPRARHLLNFLKSPLFLPGFITFYIVYTAILIFRSSFVAFGTRFFTLFDDMMISMRYAKHLAAGHGLVWNIGGPPVEGFTNFLWTLYMALLHFIPIAPSKMGLLVQLSGLIIMTVNLLLGQILLFLPAIT